VRTRLLAPALAIALAAPPSAGAATLSVSPIKPCYGSGEELAATGTGFTPNGSVRFTADGVPLSGTAPVSATGVFTGSLSVGLASGEKVKTYAAIDRLNPAIRASKDLRVSALDVTISPLTGSPGRLLRIVARGFTLGKRLLYAHIRRGEGYRRTERIGKLRHACRKLRTRKRLFSSRARSGTYRLQFDTRRRYSRRTRQRVVFTVEISRTLSAATAAARRGFR
jgi:hypothetical protein